MFRITISFITLLLVSAVYLSAENAQRNSSLKRDINKINTPVTVEQAMTAQAQDENATLVGQWAKGTSAAVTADENGHVYFGNGAEFVSAAINGSGEISIAGSVVLPGRLKDIELSDANNYAYVAMGYDGVAVVDISDLSDPQLVNVLNNPDSPFEANAVSIDGSSLFIAAGAQGLMQAQINSADDIAFGGVYKYDNCYFNDVAARNDTLFSASNNNALEMLRYSAGEFHLLNHLNYNKYTNDYQSQTPFASAVVWNNDSLFVADSWTGVFFFTVDDTVITHSGHGLGMCSFIAVKGQYLYTTDFSNINAFYFGEGTPVYQDSKKVKTSKRLAISGNYAIVAAESYGIYTFDISNPSVLGEGDFYAGGSKTYDVFQQGYYLYRVTPANTLDIISLFNPAEPKTVAQLQLDTENEEGQKVYVLGDTAAVYSYDYKTSDYTIYIIDVSDPSEPQRLASWTTENSIYDIAIKGKELYLAQNSDITVIDFSDLNNIHETGKVTTSGWIEDIAVQGDYLFTASEDAGMSVIDISDGTNPQEKTVFGRTDMDYYVKISVQGNYAYIGDSWNGLVIVDISNPLTPVLSAFYNESPGDFYADQLAVSGNYLYIQRDWGEVIFLNISDPSNPTLKGSYHLSTVTGITAYSRMVSIANTNTGIYLVSNDNPDALAPCHVAGEVSGEWNCETIYIEDDVTIPAGDTLHISDSVEKVIILGPYQIKVEGVLLAMGPEEGRVGLYGEDILFQGNKWKGIFFNNLNDSNVGTSIISHCRFDYADKMDMTYQGGGALAIYNSDNVIIKNSTFYRNVAKLGGAIYIENANPKIENCYFEINGRGGVNLSEYYTEGGGAMYIKNADPYLHHLRFVRNGAHGGGAMVIDGCSPKLSNILIEHNMAEGIAGGIHCINSASPQIVNMTAADNTAEMAGGSLYLNSNCNPNIINSIMYGNSKPEIYLDGGTPVVTYSLVDSAAGELWFGDGCLDTNPYFDEMARVNYHLQWDACGDNYNSPAIDAGHPDSIDTFLDCDAGLGTVRADMGYYGGRYAEMVTPIEQDIENIVQAPKQYKLAQNYPNPFNPQTTIQFSLPAAGHVSLKIYNVLGEKVADLIDENMNAGAHKVVFNAAQFSSGVYFYRISVMNRSSADNKDNFTAIRKMILMK